MEEWVLAMLFIGVLLVLAVGAQAMKIRELEDRIERLREWSHPPLGQEQIYHRLEALERGDTDG